MIGRITKQIYTWSSILCMILCQCLSQTVLSNFINVFLWKNKRHALFSQVSLFILHEVKPFSSKIKKIIGKMLLKIFLASKERHLWMFGVFKLNCYLCITLMIFFREIKKWIIYREVLTILIKSVSERYLNHCAGLSCLSQAGFFAPVKGACFENFKFVIWFTTA